MTAQRILVTGGAGFIGSAFIHHVLAVDPGAETLTFDALTYAGHRINLDDLPDPDRHEFVHGDIAEAHTFRETMRRFRPTGVVNFAAETHVDRSLLEPVRFVRTNVLGTQVLLDACREAGVRLVHVSTDEVYGSLPEPHEATPETPLAPSSPYAASKAAADLLVQAAHRSHDQDVLITRCTNNYGPRQLPEKLVPLMVLRALAGDTLPVYGDGLQVRDWIHVEDHVEGVLAALRSGRSGRIYHFAGRCSEPNLAVVRRIGDLVGGSASLIRHVADRPAHDRRYALDDRGTREELDWEPRIPFDQGLARTVVWYREHVSWCQVTASEELREFLHRNYDRRDA